jgi:catechol 2,3-dioxygenase-like lactoylglutathione lyase family enzyme
MAHLLAVQPISDEDVSSLPVRSLDPAIGFYESVLGFRTTHRDAGRASLRRDHVAIGLVATPGHEPGRAGSVAIAVDDLESLYHELQAAGARPGEFGRDEWDGQSHRTFFVREDQDGYCFCFYD